MEFFKFHFSLLLALKNTTALCKLTLVPVVFHFRISLGLVGFLLAYLFCFFFFLCGIFPKIFYIRSHLVSPKRSLYFFFSNYCSLLFSCLITVARTFTTMWNRSSEKEYSCLILILGGKYYCSLLNGY